MRRVVAQFVLLVLLGATNAPNLLAAFNPPLGACCYRAKGSCPCAKNNRPCFCKKKRPAGWWGVEQKCPRSAFALVTASLDKFLIAERPSHAEPAEGFTVEIQAESYVTLAILRACQRGPPARFS